ncbi:MAG: hypothetical protein ACK5MB_03250, partial [Phycisphaerales bacterium]
MFMLRTTRVEHLTRSAAIAVLALSALAGGCTPNDPADTALAEAARTLETLSSDGTQLSSDPARLREGIDKIVARAREVNSGKATQAQKAAAAVLSARASAILSLVESRQAQQGITQLTQLVGSGREALSQYLQAAGSADTNSRFDLSAERNKLATQQTRHEADAQKAEQDASRLDAQAKTLEGQAATLSTRASDLRRQAAELRAQVQGVSATEGLTLVERAAKLDRDASAVDAQIAGINGQIAALRPQIADARLRASASRRQRELLESAEKALTDRQSMIQSQASESRNTAGERARTFAQRLADARRARAESVEPAMEKAISAIRAASNGVREAEQSDRGIRLSRAGYLQSEGDLLLLRARATQDLASLLLAAGAASPAVPDAANLAAEGQKLASEADAALTEARERFTAAQEIYADAASAGGGSDELKARLGRIADALKATTEARNTISAPAPAGGTAPAATAADADPATAEVRAFLKAQAEDLSKYRIASTLAAVHTADPTQRSILNHVGRAWESMIKIDAACTEKLGKGMVPTILEFARTNPDMLTQLGLPVGTEQIQQLEAQLAADPAQSTAMLMSMIDAMPITIMGDAAMIEGLPVPLTKVNGKWGIAVPPLPENLTKVLPDVAAILESFPDALDNIASDISAGRVDAPATRGQALHRACMGGGPPLIEKRGPVLGELGGAPGAAEF